MKEKIYTIPISEAFEKRGICPFCTIKDRLNDEYCESALGAGMMEPDIRIMTNEKGFCKTHYEKLRHLNKALPLALVLQTHLSENVMSLFNTTPAKKKKSMFSSKASLKDEAMQVVEKLNTHNNNCYICSRLKSTLNDYAETSVYMFKTDKSFREIFKNAESFCLEHTETLLNAAIKNLNEKDFEEFYEALKAVQQRTLNNLYDSVSEFANSFDYRADKPLSEKAKNSISDSVKIL